MENVKTNKLKEIFYELKNGNKASYDELYKNYYKTVYGVVFSIIKNKEITEDIVQEVFIKIYNLDKSKFPDKGELSWLYIVSKNEALGYIRRRKQESNIDDIYDLSEDSKDIESLIDISTYKKMINGLTSQEQEIVTLKVLANFTFKSIGRMLSMPTATVQWKYYKAVNSLKISLANLAGAILYFMLVVTRKLKLKNLKAENKVNNAIQDDDNEENFITSESSNKKGDSANIENNSKPSQFDEATSKYVESSIESGVETVLGYFENVDLVQITLGGISSVFLVISIIFAIFFKKHQQNRKNKTSK